MAEGTLPIALYSNCLIRKLGFTYRDIDVPLSERRFTFFLNPNSRDGKTQRLFERLLSRNAIAEQLSYQLVETSSIAAMEKQLRKSDSSIVAVAVGGDGTVNMLAQAVMAVGNNRIMGVVPFGTGNAVAHQLGASTASKALSVLATGRELQIDCVETNHPEAPLALISFSSGFESILLHHYSLHRNRQRIIAGWNALFRTFTASRGPVELVLDGKQVLTEDDSVYNAGLYVINKYAYGIEMNAAALLNDGLAECVIHKSAGRYWTDIFKAAITRSPSGKAFVGRWKRAIISSPAGLQCDGERISGGTVKLNVLPKALTFLAEQKNDV